MRVMRYAAVATLLAVAPARAEGTLSLDEVITAVAKSSKLVAEIQTELATNNLKAGGVTCIAARHGNHWTYLGGGRAAPYECEIGKRTIRIDADRV